ncbi:MAG: hypothetical protein GY811_09135 [Myxococcales bacterium]|nr:hypothetical protein [Myxococcales bacterium]
MLPLSRCRELLGDPTLEDADVLRIRDQLVALAEVFLDGCKIRDAAGPVLPANVQSLAKE